MNNSFKAEVPVVSSIGARYVESDRVSKAILVV